MTFSQTPTRQSIEIGLHSLVLSSWPQEINRSCVDLLQAVWFIAGRPVSL
jgi:hypothetical protein